MSYPKSHFNKIVLLISICITICLALTGCSPVVRTKQEIPEPEYTKAGYAVEGIVKDDGKVILTYALVGVKEDKITYLHLDQIESNPSSDRHTFTNKELQSAYGLLYTGNKGEWSDQITALTAYISGNSMTIEEVNSIPTYQKDSENTMVPTEGSELGAACELNLAPFLSVINKAYNNMENIEVNYLAVGDTFRVYNKDGRIDVTLAFVGTDYRFKTRYSHIESYSITPSLSNKVESHREKAVNDSSLNSYVDNLNGFQNFIIGLNMTEITRLQTYDAGDGINTRLPKKDTDLAQVCNIDIGNFLDALNEAAGRL